MATPPPSSPDARHDDTPGSCSEQPPQPKCSDRPVKSKRPTKSPFFGAPISTSPIKKTPRKPTAGEARQSQDVVASASPKKTRPPRGTVSGLPIPPLSAPRFGLIQEELAHDHFQLLVGVTFLIRTKGTAAIPVIRAFLARFPTPESIANADPQEIIPMIRHLGLSAVRCRNLQKYASTWLERPPTKDVRYGVKNYPDFGDGANVHAGDAFGPEDATDSAAGSSVTGAGFDVRKDANLLGMGLSWEIGHVSDGPYALDSWRIFCRDSLLGRAEDWLGKGREPEFQPEWMRVLPRDKELRAYLRWLWCREGWEWDPDTGARSVLRDELREAINTSQVGYDDHGCLVIIEAVPSSQNKRDELVDKRLEEEGKDRGLGSGGLWQAREEIAQVSSGKEDE